MVGTASPSARVALLLVDVINDLDFPGSEILVNTARANDDALAQMRTVTKADTRPSTELDLARRRRCYVPIAGLTAAGPWLRGRLPRGRGPRT